MGVLVYLKNLTRKTNKIKKPTVKYRAGFRIYMQQQTFDQKVHFGHRYSCQDADRVYTLIDTVVEIKTLKNKYLSHYLKKEDKMVPSYVMDLSKSIFCVKNHPNRSHLFH